MSRCRNFSIVALTGCLFLNSAVGLYAQSDAETALKDAREAFAAEQFQQARDAAQKASQTDADNPDIFLLLGKAHFQLGEIGPAMAAWRTVLKLAPNHKYAARMVIALEGHTTDAVVRIRLARTMVDDGLLPAARTELLTLQQQTSLSDEQRQQTLMLLAEIAVYSGTGEAALATINEITSRHPDAASTLSVRVLTAQAQLVIGGEFTGIGLSDLKKVFESSAETPDGKVAELELLLHRLTRGQDAAQEIAAWIGRNGTLPAVRRARVALYNSVNGFLAASSAGPVATAESDLNQHDKSAVTAAEQALMAFVDIPDQVALIRSLTSHFEKRYVKPRAYDAARSGLALIEKMKLAEAAQEVITASRRRIDEAAATHEYMNIVRSVNEAITGPDALQQWITDHAGHPQEVEALRTLVAALLDVTRRQAVPQHDTNLSAADLRAIAVAQQLFPKLNSSSDTTKRIQTLKQHFQKHYFNRGARAAAIEGITALLPMESPVRRGALMLEIVKMQTTVAIDELKAAAAAGTLPTGAAPMPATLEAAAASVVQTCTQYPTALAWTAHADLGQQVLDATGAVPWPTIVTGPKAAHIWALDLALPVVKANADVASVTRARAVIDRIVNELAAVQQPAAEGLASATHEKLLSLLPQEHALWSVVLLRQVDLLTADAARTFDANVRSGESAKNANQTETQQEILKLLSNVVKLRPALATTALQKLDAQLQKWSAARHDTVAEAAYQSFAVDLPPTAQRRTQLALAAMWFNQVLREHAHLMSNGFQVPRALDERIQKTLKQCYQLASDIGVDDPLRASTALLRKRVVDHFLGLEYEDVAAAAIRVKADVANADLDESAELELAALQRRIAERQLAKQLRQHDGKKRIVLTPAFNQSIAALKQFITAHPTSERVPIAANGVLAIGQRFEQYEAWVIAAGIYDDFELFAAEIDSLKQAGPKESTYPEKAAAARASALHTRASHALAKWISEKPDDTPPPNQLSDEFQTAQAAWHKVIADYQQRPVVQTAIARSMSIKLRSMRRQGCRLIDRALNFSVS